MLWKRGEIARQFLLFSTIFYNLILDFCVITRTRFFLRDKRLFEITEVEITRVDCTCICVFAAFKGSNALKITFKLSVQLLQSTCQNITLLSKYNCHVKILLSCQNSTVM